MGRTKNHKSNVPAKSKLKKDPGVPKLPDLKVKVKTQQKKPEVPLERRLDPDTPMASEPTLSSLAQMAAQASQNIPDDPSSSTSVREKTKEQLRRYYLKSLHKVIDQSDIILLVLDARDPEGCRSRLVEEEVRRRESEGKKLLFVLNKIDLVPKSNAQAWLKYLRHSTPTLPFLAPNAQRSNVSSSTAPALMKLLKAYKPKTRSVTVGVVGYPNVGKSSIINCLKRSKVCSVAATPGHTKDLQSIQIERGLRVIDSPGVVFDDDDFDDGKGSKKKGSVLLRNVVRVEDVEDPIEVVEEILLQTPFETIQKIYNLPPFATPLEFLTMLALSSGRLHKGGTPDLNSAARHVLNDWNQQKIPYSTVPPEMHPSLIPSTVHVSGASAAPVIAPGAEQVGQAQILATYSKPFELEGLFNTADAGAFRTGDAHDVAMYEEEDQDVFIPDEPHAMDEDGTGMITDRPVLPSIPRKRTRSPSPAPDPQNVTMDTGDLPAQYTRQPKRQRRNKDVPEYDAKPDKHVMARMGASNPLNRKALKRDAKKARKAARHEIAASGAAMDMDEDNLQFTFMA